MRVVCPYTVLQPETARALARHAPGAELVPMRDEQHYWGLLADLWAAGEAFVVVEHDIEIHGGVLSQFEECPEPWCVFPFSGGHELLYESLGCARFSAELLKAKPMLMAGLWHRHWYGLDTAMGKALKASGYRAHAHSPRVLHRHPWRPPSGHVQPCPCPACVWLLNRIP